jgi:hypothetical protein
VSDQLELEDSEVETEVVTTEVEIAEVTEEVLGLDNIKPNKNPGFISRVFIFKK